MPEKAYRELVTVDGHNIVLNHRSSPVGNREVVEAGDALFKLDVFDDRFRPENYNKADGSPLRMFDAGAVKVDLSKRSKEDMGFWHRNIDYHEIIFCVRGAQGRGNDSDSQGDFPPLHAVRRIGRRKRFARAQDRRRDYLRGRREGLTGSSGTDFPALPIGATRPKVAAIRMRM